MDIINWIGEVITAIAKHGLSVTTLAVAVTALLRVNAVRRMILRRLPKRFRHADKLERIEHKLDLILQKEGLQWDAAKNDSISNIAKNTALKSAQRSLISRSKTLFRADTAAQYTRRVSTTYLRRNHRMKSNVNWVTLVVALLGAAKLVLQAFGIDVITDDMIDKASNVVAALVTLVGVIMSHRKGEKTDDTSSNLNVESEM